MVGNKTEKRLASIQNQNNNDQFACNCSPILIFGIELIAINCFKNVWVRCSNIDQAGFQRAYRHSANFVDTLLNYCHAKMFELNLRRFELNLRSDEK